MKFNKTQRWSLGVIIYVSLSGQFPFEEDRDIYEQILNSKFMFPKDKWKNISSNGINLSFKFTILINLKFLFKLFLKAINLIDSLLKVRISERMSANKALNHHWFSMVYYKLEKKFNL